MLGHTNKSLFSVQTEHSTNLGDCIKGKSVNPKPTKIDVVAEINVVRLTLLPYEIFPYRYIISFILPYQKYTA